MEKQYEDEPDVAETPPEAPIEDGDSDGGETAGVEPEAPVEEPSAPAEEPTS